jgi:hypothetical protein
MALLYWPNPFVPLPLTHRLDGRSMGLVHGGLCGRRLSSSTSSALPFMQSGVRQTSSGSSNHIAATKPPWQQHSMMPFDTSPPPNTGCGICLQPWQQHSMMPSDASPPPNTACDAGTTLNACLRVSHCFKWYQVCIAQSTHLIKGW